MKRLAILAIVVFLQAQPIAQDVQSAAQSPDLVGRLLLSLERAISSGRVDDFRAIAVPGISQAAIDRFSATVGKGAATRAVVKERLRRPKGASYDILADVLVSQDMRGHVAEWMITATGEGANSNQFRIADLQELASLRNLLKLRLDTSQQFRVNNLR
ncbi:MAG TPA: hypothetical protein VFV78_15080, partial [Vicinamibacterales bacterium]|nr:hypothetical protein [Vicinamibacterales bacterium]